MSESNLRKEFSKRDVQRMRNIIGGNAGGATGTQLGYSKQHVEYEEGDIWEENGRKWTIKNGIKQTITKFDELKKLFVLPISCPNCSQPMKINDLNKKMYSIHKMCFDCVVEMEGKLKAQGKYEEYASNLLNLNKNHMLDDFETAVEQWLTQGSETFVSEQGDVESWNGGKINEDEIKNVKEYIKKLRETTI